ncbi:MAG: NOP5/NOP56 family protein [Candidatus Nanoarchaeia archaeon]|nr:NOP5/NOP56 family protein [Candidatus Nanoarchaeia archaeon]
MVLYIYSNIIGSFVFNTNLRIIDRFLFNEKSIVKNAAKLENNEWLDEEKALIEKHGHKIICLGGKKEKLIETSNDYNFHDISERISEIPDFYTLMRKAGIVLSRNKIKKSVKQDILVIQAVNNLDEIDRVANTLIKRLREWYELYLPEFSKKVRDNEKFVELVLKKKKTELLKEINMISKDSMGAELSEADVKPIMELAKRIQSLYSLRKNQSDYLESVIKKAYPNFYELTGHQIGAKLISFAGGFEKLAKFPASTVQLLGAEQAMFRHLKTGAKSPKYGILHEHSMVMHAKSSDKGRVARALADKISIALKVDFFKGKFIGDKLRKQLEKRFKNDNRTQAIKRNI